MDTLKKINPSIVRGEYQVFTTYNEYINPILIRLKDYLVKCYVGIPRVNSLEHVYDVTIKCLHILNYSRGYSIRDSILIVLAALFHDIGHVEGKVDHEERSAKMFPDIAKVLNDKYNIQLCNDGIDTIVRIISLHKNDSTGFGPLETILSDADNLEFHPLDTISRRGLRVQDQHMTENQSNNMFSGIFDWTANNEDTRIILSYVKNIHKNIHSLYDVDSTYISNIYKVLENYTYTISVSITDGNWKKIVVLTPNISNSLGNVTVQITPNKLFVNGVEVELSFDVISLLCSALK